MPCVISLVALVVSSMGCGMRVSFTETEAGRSGTALSRDCPVRFFRDESRISPSCVELATASLGDTGFSIQCGSGEAREHLRRITCDLGGDTVVQYAANNSMSTCISMNATVYRCGEAGSADADVSSSAHAPGSSN